MKLRTEVVDLSADLRKNVIKLEVKDGQGTFTGLDKIYAHALGDEDMEHDKRLHDKRSTAFTATAKAIGELGIDAMKKHPNLVSLEAVVPLQGKDSFTVTVDRQREYPKPGSKTGEKIKAFGVLNTQLDTVSSRSNLGQMKQVRQELQEAAMAAFGS